MRRHRIGYFVPTSYQQVMDLPISSVAFTPLQNVTGKSAISLLLAQSADDMTVGMMFHRRLWTGNAIAGTGLRTRRSSAMAVDPIPTSRQLDLSLSNIRLNSLCRGALS